MALLLGVPEWGLATGTDVPLKQLRHTTWLAKDGLPPSALRAIEQTPDGFLWLGTFGGLYRFDGLRFDNVPLPRDTKLLSSSISALLASREGGLWLGFTFGGIGLLKNGRLTLYGRDDGVPPGTVRAIAEDASGVAWMLSSSGLAKQETDGRWNVISTSPATLESRDLRFDSHDTLWIGDARGAHFLRSGEAAFQAISIQMTGDQEAAAEVILGSDGGVWIANDTTARRVDTVAVPPRFKRGHAPSAMVDANGLLWVVRGGELIRVRLPADGRTVAFADASDRLGSNDGFLSYREAHGLFTTNDEQVWAISAASMDRFSHTAVAMLDTSFLAPVVNQALTVGVASDGGMWLMPGAGALVHIRAGQKPVPALPVDVDAIGRTADGTTWAGGQGALWRLTGQGWLKTPLPAEALASSVQAIAGHSADDLWISVVRKGVYRWHAGRWLANGGLPGLPSEPAVTMTMDAAGSLWLGYADGRIARVPSGAAPGATTLPTLWAADQVGIGVVTALFARGNSLWAGGEFGLRHWNGDAFVPLHADRERAFDLITGVVETAAGDVWLNSAAGIVRVPADDVARVAAGMTAPIVVDVFDGSDGFMGSGARVRPLPTAVEATDGTLWFSSNTGVFSIDPKTSVVPREPPATYIQALVANGVRHEPPAPIALDKGTREIRIDFVGLDLVVPERVRYRYRLDGVDADWRDVGSQRQAFYTNLGAGKYQFHVLSSSDGRRWSPKEASLGFRIEPKFTETVWFAALCLIAAFAAVALLFRWRLRQIRQRLRWKVEAQLGERDRIARELHDTLLQSTQGLILRFQAITNRMPNGDEIREKMETALERADEVLTEGRDRVRGLRRSGTSRSTLTDSLRTFGEELAADAGIRFQYEMAGGQPVFPPDIADEVQRIVCEALVNACRHGQARLIDLNIANDPLGLTVTVQDDGVGIDSATANAGVRAGHWGLRGMHERSERIGARLSIGARAVGGTKVELVVPTRRTGSLQ